jgi:hypothetical protein
MNLTMYERAEQDALRQVLRELLDERFGPVPLAVQERLQQFSAKQLKPLVKAVPRASSLRDLGLED